MLIKAIAVLTLTGTLAACVPAVYRHDGQTYKSREEAMAAAERRNTEADAAVSAGIKPLVARNILVAIPTAAALSRTFEARGAKDGKALPAPGTPARAQFDFDVDAQASNWRSITVSLKKANIYQNVIVHDADTTEANIQPTTTQDVMTIHFSAGGGSQVIYFQSAKYGKQVVAFDTGKTSLGERRKSLIDDIKAKALQ